MGWRRREKGRLTDFHTDAYKAYTSTVDITASFAGFHLNIHTSVHDLTGRKGNSKNIFYFLSKCINTTSIKR